MLEIYTFPDLATIKAIFIGLAVILYIIVSVLLHKVSILDILDFREIWIFNTREIAIFICLIIPIFILCFKSNSILIQLREVLKAFFVKPIIIVCLLAVLYLTFIVLIFDVTGFWKLSFFKNAIIWLIFSASITIFRINEAKKDYFKDIILENFKISAVIEFIIGIYTFNLIVEIFIVIVSFLIGGLMVYSKGNEHKDVRKLLNIFAIILGGLMLYFSLYQVIQHFDNFNMIEKLSEFSLPILLTVLFTPFFYSLYLYMNYDSRFTIMKFSIENNYILSYAKRKSIITFKTDIESLSRWVNTLHLDEPKTKEDIQESILKFKTIKSIEANPPVISNSEGWSPYKAKDFLKANGIETRFYTNCFEKEWQASSPYIELNTDLIVDGKYYLADNVAYYVSGDNRVATKLKLILNINSKKEEELSLMKFNEHVKALYKAALDKNLPASITHSIVKRRNKNIKQFYNSISITKHEFLNKDKGYSLVFAIVHEQSPSHISETQT
ncbi:hypothetical protein ACS5NO_30775 [Larkinella sp. GY13]|uniref:hypothetical protein n=1 Tax=Larkinella sp. GY13 TaxID=3453720 RepID=UPI003EEFEFB5